MGEFVLVTGATGFIGFRTLVESLRARYKVRVAVRRESSIEEIKAATSIQPFLSSFSIIVDDITKEGAFDDAVKDVSYVIHLASPLAKPSNDPEADIIQPATNGTLSILCSALKQQNVKRVVVTSSVVAVAPLAAYTGKTVGIITPKYRFPTDQLPRNEFPNYFVAYAVSKIPAFNTTLDFIEKERTRFEVINVIPSFVIGKNELATSPKAVNSGSNALVLNALLGVQNPAGTVGISVHVDDVAKVHVSALDPKITGHRNLGASSNGVEGIKWEEAVEIVKRHFPGAVQKGVFPLGGSQAIVSLKYDTSETERVFDFKFKNFEEQIVSLAGLYAEVSARA